MMEKSRYLFTVKFTVRQYFQMLFEYLCKVLPVYVIPVIVSCISGLTVINELSGIALLTFLILIFIYFSIFNFIIYLLVCLAASIFRTFLARKLTYCFFEDTFIVKGHLLRKEPKFHYGMLKKIMSLKHSSVFYEKKMGCVWLCEKIFTDNPEFEAFFFEKLQNHITH